MDKAMLIMQYEVQSELMRIRIAEARAHLALLVETEATLRNLINLTTETAQVMHVGAWVMLRSGGPAMRVLTQDTNGGHRYCEWETGAGNRTSWFPVESLVPAPRSKIPYPLNK